MRAFLLSCVLLLSFTVAHADNVLITSGSTVVTGNPGLARFQFSLTGTNFSLAGNTGYVVSADLPHCCFQPSTPLNSATSTMFWHEWSGGTVTRGQSSYVLNAPGSNTIFTFSGGMVTIPALGDEFVTLTAPFNMSGRVSFQVNNGFLFSDVLSGHGIASMLLERSENGYNFRSVTYTFENPEPSTILLIASGLVGLAYKLRKPA